MAHKHTNSLIKETSPYLLQHAHNPVEWYPWGAKALERAKAEKKPILLSIGYSACHWCHVMERESFEDEDTAAIMNQNFINIKVDREERPDIDQIYQTASQMFLGQGGGWPLNVFLTPDGKPFYGGTYFPPTDYRNIPSFSKVLIAIADAYKQRHEDIQETTLQIVKGLNQLNVSRPSEEAISIDAVKEAAQSIKDSFEPIYGGFGSAPKFPNTAALSLLLRYYRLTGDTTTLYCVRHTLKKMAEGGIHDHLGGGFHRYSVDDQWLIPHFEKMLYDNSQLINIYLEAYQVTGDESFKDIAVKSLAYIRREMLSPEGVFYSTQDADIEGEEGKFFLWTQKEVMDILGEEIGRIFCRYYDVTVHGNFEGKNILHADIPVKVIADEFHKPPEEVDRLLKDAGHKMFLSREKKGKPFRDEKILTSWNALMISAAVKAYNILGDIDYLKIGRECTDFILKNLFKNNRLLSNYKDGAAGLNGYLDDYGFFIASLLDIYEATLESYYLEKADMITNIMLGQFWDESGGGGFYFTGNDHEALIARVKSGYDHSIPSGNAIAAMDILRLYHLMDSKDYLSKAETILRLFYQSAKENPFGYASMFSALDFYLEGPKEIMIVGKKESPELAEMLKKIHQLYQPNKVITFVDAEQTKRGQLPSILRGKDLKDNKLTVYVCHNFTCSKPVTEWADLKELLLSK